MIEDAELLRRYAEEGSQDSFTELVNRHVGLVYFGALRRTSDAHLSADVSQTVFIALAQNARALRSHPSLHGWLFTTTKNTVINFQIAQRRRQQREQETVMMHDSTGDENPAVDWEQLRPLLYETLDQLPERDRQAVLQRFFGGRSFGDIGRSLRLTEDAARKRVDRAMDALQVALSRRGITSTMAAIAAALNAEALAQPPMALASAISSAAAVSAASGTATASALSFILMSKIKIGIIGAIAATGLVVSLLQFNTARALTAELKRASQSTGQFIALQKENENLDKELSKTIAPGDREELARLRNQIASLKARPVEVDEAKMLPVANMKNAGWATPAASFETLTWAQNQPPETFLDLFAASFRFDPATKAKADALFATLSDEVRAKFQTPERLFAPVFFGSGSSENPIVAVQILDQTNHDNDPDQVVVRWWQVSANGGGFQGRLNLTRVGDEWLQARRNPIPEEQWQKIVSQIDPQTGAVRLPKK